MMYGAAHAHGSAAPRAVLEMRCCGHRVLTLEAGRRAGGAGAPGHPAPGRAPAGEPVARPAALEGMENAHTLDLTAVAGVAPAALPLRLSMFDRVPVVVSARQYGTTGRPSEPFARLLLR